MIARLRKRRAAVFTAIAVVVCGLTAGGGAWAYHTRFVRWSVLVRSRV